MFFFFPFFAEGQASSNGGGAPRSQTLPLLPAPRGPGASNRAWDFGDFAVDLLRQTISAVTSSLTALGSQANALFTQVAAALAFDRVARDTAAFIEAAWSGFGVPKARAASFGNAWRGQAQDPMSFSPFLTQGFNPFAINPWAAFSEGMNFWSSLWMPAAPQRNLFARNAPATPFMAKVSAPNGFSWGFSWGA